MSKFVIVDKGQFDNTKFVFAIDKRYSQSKIFSLKFNYYSFILLV